MKMIRAKCKHANNIDIIIIRRRRRITYAETSAYDQSFM